MKRGISFAIAACVAVVACLHGGAIYAAESTNEKPLRIAVYVGDALAGTCSGTGEQSMRFIVSDPADEIRFVYTPEAGSTAVLKKFSGARGFSISFR